VTEPHIDWSTAEVREGKLSVEIEGEIPRGWKRSFETVARLLSHGDSPGPGLRKRVVTVEVSQGEEEKVHHFLESVVLQANADHRPAEEDEADDDEGEDDDLDLLTPRPDSEMADRFRAFAPQASGTDE
jgi:hypothetical protein